MDDEQKIILDNIRRARLCRAFEPSAHFQTPSVAKYNDSNRLAWGRHLVPQECAAVMMAIYMGEHSAVGIVRFVRGAMPELEMTSNIVTARCKSMSLTGFLRPYVEALAGGKYRWMWYLLDGDVPDYLLSLDEVNERYEGDEVMKWVRNEKPSRVKAKA